MLFFIRVSTKNSTKKRYFNSQILINGFIANYLHFKHMSSYRTLLLMC